MKRAILFMVLAIFILLVIQPNLSADTSQAPVRIPEYSESVITNDDVTRTTSESKSLIVIDPGKGGNDAGYDPVGHISEKDAAMSLAIHIGDALEAAGYQVEYTRWYDNVENFSTERESDSARLAKAKDMNAAVLLSLRFTTSDSLTKGFSVFSQPNSEQLDALASELASQIQSTNYSTFEGIDLDHYANFPTLADKDQPAILLQMGYLTNSEDYSKITDPQFQNRIGSAIAQAFLNTIN